MQWQIQEAKQQLSELIRSVEADGPQMLTRHGQEIAVVISIDEYRRLRGVETDFKDALKTSPYFDAFEITRQAAPARVVDWAAEV